MTWLIYAITAAVLLTAALIIEKKTLIQEHAMQFSAVLAIINLLVGFPLFLIADYTTLNSQIIIMMFFASIFGGLAFLFMAKSIRHTDISVSVPLLALSPALTALIGFILLGEILSYIQILGILLIVIGSYCITFNKKENILKNIIKFFTHKYYRAILLAIIFYSFASVVDKFMLTTYNLEPGTYVAIMQIFIAFHLFVMISIFHRGIKDIKEGFKKAKWLILLVSVFTVGYRVAQSAAFKQIETGIVIAIKRMSALLVVIIGGEIFHEKHLLKRIFASIIMIVGVLLLIL